MVMMVMIDDDDDDEIHFEVLLCSVSKCMWCPFRDPGSGEFCTCYLFASQGPMARCPIGRL